MSQQDEPRQNLTGPQTCPISLAGAKPLACCKQWQQHNSEAGRDTMTTLGINKTTWEEGQYHGAEI